MRKTNLITLCLVVCSLSAHAQQTASFQPHWNVEVQAGIANTSGEGSFGGMMSPAFSINVGYRFSEPFELRLAIGGFSGKGYAIEPAAYYCYDFVRAGVDALWHPFPGLRGLYAFAGTGVMVGTNNGAERVNTDWAVGTYFKGLWKAPKAFWFGRLGAGYLFPVSRTVSLGAEAIYSLLPDAVNSKLGGKPDCSVQLLASARFSFGAAPAQPRVKPAPAARQPRMSKKAAAEAERAAEEARIAAEKAAAERAAAEKAAAEKAAQEARLAAERAAAEKAAAEARLAAEKAAAEKAAAEQLAAEAEAITSKVFFASNSWTVQTQYKAGLGQIATFLNTHPDWVVDLVAYSDSSTGSAVYNKTVSLRRVRAVTKALTDAGAPADRISSEAAGGTNAFSEKGDVSGNRVVICTLRKAQ